MNTQTRDNEASAATDGSTSFVGGVWYPLGGQLEGTDSAWIMFHGPRRSGEKHEQTEQRFNDVLIRNEIELQDELLMACDFERFRIAMAGEGWTNEFIALGP